MFEGKQGRCIFMPRYEAWPFSQAMIEAQYGEANKCSNISI
jgi:hypothetical protein